MTEDNQQMDLLTTSMVEDNQQIDLLTYRLSHFMTQISDNQIAQLIEKDRKEHEKLRKAKKSMMRFDTQKSSTDHLMGYKAVKAAAILTKKRYELGQSEEAEKPKSKKVEIGTLWGVSNKFKSRMTKDSSDTKPSTAKNAFFKAAKMAVLINHVKDGKTVCTCESLDSKCLVHDV